MITRQRAVRTLYTVINCGIIDEELEMSLQDIANCIEDETYLGIHAWGMSDEEYMKLHTARRTDLPDYEDYMKECREIYGKYKFNDKDTGDRFSKE